MSKRWFSAGSVPLFPVFLLVFPLRDVLVFLDSLGRLPRLVEIELAGVFRAHGDVRQQALEIAALALRARRDVAGPYELLELVVAAPALEFVDRHLGELYELPNPKSQIPKSQLPNPNSQLPNPNSQIPRVPPDATLGVGNWWLGVERYTWCFVGAWLSLVERSVRDREVAGS